MMWIVGALYGGYVMANVLKWYWWRFNGYGYFWGMVTGIGAAMIASEVAANASVKAWFIEHIGNMNSLYLIPPILVALRRRLPRRHAPHPAGRRSDAPQLLHERPARGASGGRSATKRSPGFPASSPTTTSAEHVQRRRRHRLATLPDGAADLRRPATMELGGSVAATLVATSIVLKLTWFDRLEINEA